MFYKLDKLARKLKRSKSFIIMCVDRFGIKRIRLKTTNQLVYDIPKEKMEEIMEFNYARKRNYKDRTKKTD